MGANGALMISFGFVIAEFFQEVRERQGETATVFSPRAVGLVMITIGLVGLIRGELAGTAGRERRFASVALNYRIRVRRDFSADRVALRPGADWRATPIATFAGSK